MVLNIIWMIILGLIVGWIARLIVPGKENFGWIATALLGIIGGYVGGTLGSLDVRPAQIHRHPADQSRLPRRAGGRGDSAGRLQVHRGQDQKLVSATQRGLNYRQFAGLTRRPPAPLRTSPSVSQLTDGEVRTR